MKEEKLKQPTWKEGFKQNYVAPIIVSILILALGLVIDSHHNNQETKEEIDYHFNKAYSYYNNGQFNEALDEYNEILKISYNKYPYEYASAQSEIGVTYGRLGEVRDKEINAECSINALQKALEIYTSDKYPLDYAMGQNNLGNAYLLLAEVREKEINAQNAIYAQQKALEVYRIEKHPYHYAGIQNNLGNAYLLLAEVKDKENNTQNAIKAYQKALEVYTPDKYPINYAKTQNNIKIAKGLLK